MSGAEKQGSDRAPPLPLAALTALGVVFGDIGTSPLYTMQTIVEAAGSSTGPDTALGILSLIAWTLIIVISVKYCLIVMRADNHGEGGILALTSLLGLADWKRGAYAGAAMGFVGAALIYGDGVITPAISVLSALEGVNVATSALKPYVLPAAIVVLALLFFCQRFGTRRIGHAFGPVMLVWFITIGALGVTGVVRHPGVLVAIDPHHAIALVAREPWVTTLLILGGVFLCCTGGEALYADMGNVGRRPIRVAWYALVLPALLLNYAGQTGILIDGQANGNNPFFALAPDWARYPLVAIATIATIIASQAIITGSFAMTRQAIQLGWLPRMKILQTSKDAIGQIYIPAINVLMAAATIAIALAFRSSDRLSGAYGMAVSTTMLLTTLLLFRAMRDRWHWPAIAVWSLTTLFFVVDATFVGANLLKIPDGGYVPLVVGAVLFGVMLTWRVGHQHVLRRTSKREMSVAEFEAFLARDAIPRTRGTGIFLSNCSDRVPAIVVDYVKSFGSLKSRVVAVSVTVEDLPRVPEERRATCRALSTEFWSADIRYGFMETCHLPAALRGLDCFVDRFDLDSATYFADRDFVLRSDERPAMSVMRTRLFAYLFRNGARIPDRFDLPPERTVEIARQIEI